MFHKTVQGLKTYKKEQLVCGAFLTIYSGLTITLNAENIMVEVFWWNYRFVAVCMHGTDPFNSSTVMVASSRAGLSREGPRRTMCAYELAGHDCRGRGRLANTIAPNGMKGRLHTYDSQHEKPFYGECQRTSYFAIFLSLTLDCEREKLACFGFAVPLVLHLLTIEILSVVRKDAYYANHFCTLRGTNHVVMISSQQFS